MEITLTPEAEQRTEDIRNRLKGIKALLQTDGVLTAKAKLEEIQHDLRRLIWRTDIDLSIDTAQEHPWTKLWIEIKELLQSLDQ